MVETTVGMSQIFSKTTANGVIFLILIRKPYVHDQRKRNEVIAQSFSKDKVKQGVKEYLSCEKKAGGLCFYEMQNKDGSATSAT